MKESFYKDILFNSSIGYAYHEIIVDEKGVACDYKFLEVNKAFQSYTGLVPKDLIGKTILEVVPDIVKDDFDWISYYGNIVADNKRETSEHFSQALNKWYKIEAFSPEKNHFVTIISDVTEGKKTEHDLDKLEDVFSSVIKNAPIPIMIHRDDGKVLNISDTWIDITGYSRKDIPTIQSWAKYAYGQKQSKIVDFVSKLYSLKERQHDGEFWVRTKDDRKILWDFYSMYIGDTEDGKKMAMSVAFDVTNERNVKDKLFNEQQLLQTTLRSIGDAVICTNKKGEITLMNKIGEQLTGWKEEDVLGKDMEEVFTIYNENSGLTSENIVEKVIRTGKTQELSNHTILRSNDGTERPIADSAAPITLNNGEIVGVIVVFRDYTDKYNDEKEIKELVESLQKSRILIRASLNSPLDMIILSVDKNFNYLFYNKAHERAMKVGYNADIKVGECIFDFMDSDEEIKKAKSNYEKALQGEEHTTIQQYGTKEIYVYETIYSPIRDDNNEIIGVSTFARNISEQIKANNQIKESEEKYRLLYSSMNQGLALHEIILDEEGNPIDYFYLDINDSYTELLGVTREQCIGKRITEVMPKVEPYWIRIFGKVALTGEPMYYENYLETTKRYYSTYSYSPKKGQFAVLVSDITERIEREEKIEYLSYHDYLTGLYNRRFYEEELAKLDVKDNLPISLIMGDVNGLKLVNDSFGHQVGDELLVRVARILEEACRASDVIARIGGDEFVIILPKTKKEDAAIVIERIASLTKSETVESIDVSISFGYGTKTSKKQSLFEMFKEIEDEMYSQKITESRSMRSKTIDIIMQSLFEKNDREMSHSERVSNLCEKLANKLGLDADTVKQVKTAGLMHDIGKIGIDEEILNKTGKLTELEWAEIKRHPEVGYRILSSVDEFNDIANSILQHHERWDGSGYPNALKKDEISLKARIINISDAFDAMTSYRTYRPKLTVDQAIVEIKNNIETQFDPYISKIFVTEVLGKSWD